MFLGVGGIGVNCSTNPCTVTGTANNIEMDSPLMSTPSGHNTDWNNVNLSFTPTAADLTGGSAILTFLAWGDGGSTTNLPPTVFLEGVNTPPTVPEPSSLALLGMGLARPWRAAAASAQHAQRGGLIALSVHAPGRDLLSPRRERRARWQTRKSG